MVPAPVFVNPAAAPPAALISGAETVSVPSVTLKMLLVTWKPLKFAGVPVVLMNDAPLEVTVFFNWNA